MACRGIYISQTSVMYHKARHIDTRVCHLRELCKDCVMVLEKVASAEQVADSLTKSMPKPAFEKHHESAAPDTAPATGANAEDIERDDDDDGEFGLLAHAPEHIEHRGRSVDLYEVFDLWVGLYAFGIMLSRSALRSTFECVVTSLRFARLWVLDPRHWTVGGDRDQGPLLWGESQEGEAGWAGVGRFKLMRSACHHGPGPGETVTPAAPLLADPAPRR
eukprot:2362412-Rhodomonas_salina.1